MVDERWRVLERISGQFDQRVHAMIAAATPAHIAPQAMRAWRVIVVGVLAHQILKLIDAAPGDDQRGSRDALRRMAREIINGERNPALEPKGKA